MLTAAKETIFPLAALPAKLARLGPLPLSQNSHRGHQLPTPVLYPGIGFAISNTTTGLHGTLYDEGRRSRGTGKQRDQETGLDYFGARYYGSNMGRFMSPDPMLIMQQKLMDPQQWNMYAYARDNPLRYIDQNGKWPTEIHNQIIDRAFPGLSNHQRSILKSASAGMDHCITCQTEKNSYQHSMRAPDQSVGDAKQQTQNFIKTEESKAQADQKGDTGERIEYQ
ncbi:MAG: RHS repeat-associated core domain-containing protein [Acidobacteriota bacterium]|nr:RHS repeat-associated core domain-containing protein [Acidobacteriota bacterium]